MGMTAHPGCIPLLPRVWIVSMPIPRFFFALALCVCVVACKREAVKAAAKPDAAAFVADGGGDGSVWVVDGPNGGRLFLCGTIHILREKDYPLAPAYEAAYMYSNKLVLELPPGAASGPDTPAFAAASRAALTSA